MMTDASEQNKYWPIRRASNNAATPWSKQYEILVGASRKSPCLVIIIIIKDFLNRSVLQLVSEMSLDGAVEP